MGKGTTQKEGPDKRPTTFPDRREVTSRLSLKKNGGKIIYNVTSKEDVSRSIETLELRFRYWGQATR